MLRIGTKAPSISPGYIRASTPNVPRQGETGMKEAKTLRSATQVRGKVGPDAIIASIEYATGMRRDAILGKSKRQSLADARAIAMYFGRQLLEGPEWSFSALAHMVNRTDHVTARHACHRVATLVAARRPNPNNKLRCVLTNAAEHLGVDPKTFVPLERLDRWKL